MRIKVNGEPFNIPSKKNIKELLDELEIRQDNGIAVAVNHTVIPRSRFHEVFINEGDCVEVIQAPAGG
jgi:sulfur carrier protein